MSVDFQSVNPLNKPLFENPVTQVVPRQQAEAAPETPPVGPQEKKASLPVLPQPVGSTVDAGTALALPSMGASTLALLTQVLDEQRRANREVQFQESQLTAQKIKDQAESIRDQATANLAMGLVSATIQCAASVTTVVGTSKALCSTAGMGSEQMAAAKLQALSTRVSAVSQAVQGVASGVDSVRQAVSASYDAGVKEADAAIEQIRAYREQLDGLDDSLKEVIRKAIATQDEIQKNINQTRTRILG